MSYVKKHAKRIASDGAGYFLILLGAAIGWLPGPGGIPLVLAGLGLLSINNEWAARLRQYLVKNSERLIKIAFPDNKMVQFIYDALAIAVIATGIYLVAQHTALWQLSVGIALICISIVTALINRDRYLFFKRKL